MSPALTCNLSRSLPGVQAEEFSAQIDRWLQGLWEPLKAAAEQAPPDLQASGSGSLAGGTGQLQMLCTTQ